MCIDNFHPNMTEPCINSCYTTAGTTRLYPKINFTCNGTVTKWKASVEQRLNGNRSTLLWIWRETSRGEHSVTYQRIDTQPIELVMCGSGTGRSASPGMRVVYECNLPESSRVTVQPGDIIGTEEAAQNVQELALLYNSQGIRMGPTGHVFTESRTTATLGNGLNVMSDYIMPNEIPQISLTVEPIMETFTTIQPEPQTESEGEAGTTAERTESTTNPDTTASTAPDTTSSQATSGNGSSVENSFPKELIIGALVTGMVMIALLIAIAFILAYLSRRVGDKRDGKERRSGSSQKSSNVIKDLRDMEYNEAYIPQIPLKDNIAYVHSQGADPCTVVVYDTILEVNTALEPNNLSTMTREVSVSNVYSSVP